jgi:DNA mismatch repair protein MutS
MMSQYWDIKEQVPDALLLFRMGDFYETFHEDAQVAARVLGITLTTRDRDSDAPVPLAGVPHHSIDNYIARLLRAGHKVAVCEQLEDPATTKGLVKRGITEILTPGTALTPALLEERENHYALSLFVPPDADAATPCGFAFLDFSTGEFGLGQRRRDDLLDVVASYTPNEVFLSASRLGDTLEARLRGRFESIPVSHIEDAAFAPEIAAETLRRHFGVASLAGLDCGDLPQGVRAAGALLDHGSRLKQTRLDAVTALQVVRSDEEMILDEDTLNNLEVFRPLRGQDTSITVVHQLDACRTTMGSRLLRRWLRAPLRDRQRAAARHEAVRAYCENAGGRDAVRGMLGAVGDLERLMGRIAADRATPRDLQALAETAERLPRIKEHLQGQRAPLLQELEDAIDPLSDLATTIRKTLVDDPPAHVREGGVIRSGVSRELDELLDSTRDARDWIAGLQATERQRSGIAKLKVGYNKVFGYYLEVPRSAVDQVPDTWVGKQTLVNAQRYITPELKEKEQLVLRADSERIRIEAQLFAELRQSIAAQAARVHRSAAAIAGLDVLSALAFVAHKNEYVCPRLTDGDRIRIRGGRHPVVEQLVGKSFVGNDLDLSRESAQILLITGPNMGGKSTYLRQVALITLMACIGSFVPADEAEIGRVDRIFTRVGASDNLARGQSTFLVEMTETARILNACTSESLVILDEVGRGTSTHDGMSLAWAVLEHLHADNGPRPRTLFATHYHELTVLEDSLERLHNLTVEVREWQDEIIFLHRIRPGRADKSYGIQVARLAGLPRSVIDRAQQLLTEHERMESMLGEQPAAPSTPRRPQLDLFASAEKQICDELRQADADLSPEQAQELLNRLRRRL